MRAAGLVFALVAVFGTAQAHEALEHYGLFTIRTTFDGAYLDTSIAVAFTGEGALDIRRAMDTGGDGYISADERTAYLEALQASLPQRITIQAGGAPLPLTPLYEPEIWLEGEERTTEHPLRLQFTVFSRLPAGADRAQELVLGNRLFEDMPAVIVWEIRRKEGADGEAQILAQQRAVFGMKEHAAVRRGQLRVTLPAQTVRAQPAD